LFTQEWILGVGVRAQERSLEFTMADRLFVAIPALQLIPVFQHPIHLPLAEGRVNSHNTRCCLLPRLPLHLARHAGERVPSQV